jgi:hypothetical protein
MGVSKAFPSCALALLAAGCVESFPGANVQIDFSGATPTPARRGTAPVGVQPPADTYFSLWASKETKDDTGDVIRTDQFEVERFEIRPVIDLSSPCFIDLEDSRFPGIHATRFYERLLDEVGIGEDGNPAMPPPNIDRNDLIDALTAQVRDVNLPRLQGAVKTVSSASLSFDYQNVQVQTGDECNPVEGMIPPPNCDDDESNRIRLEECQRQWATDPLFYEGSDKVFSLPLNGAFYGVVEGMNPINGGLLGGSALFVDESLADAASYSIRWQYKDLNNDQQPDDPGAGAHGVVFMEGRPEVRTRGVKNARLINGAQPNIAAEMVIFPDLARDDVAF